MIEKVCYCGSNKAFSDCCEPIIKGERKAPTASALMRSRYSAYVTAATDYLISSSHPTLRKNTSAASIEEWAKENKWQGLEIISTTLGGEKHERGEVEFKAYFSDKSGLPQIHHENSVFLKENDQWFYFKGSMNPKTIVEEGKTGRNDPCPCGSGLKYKKCCS